MLISIERKTLIRLDKEKLIDLLGKSLKELSKALKLSKQIIYY